MKLRTKFAVGLLLATVVLSGSVYGGLEFYKDQIVDQARDDVNETATLTAEQLDYAIEDRKDFVGFAASRPDASEFNESDRFLREFVDNSRFFAAQLIDANGTIIDFHGDVTQDLQRESIGSDVSERPYVANALQGEVYVSDAEYANSTEQYLVVISAPIFEDREIKGTLAAALYLERQTVFGVLGPLAREDQRVNVTTGTNNLYSGGGTFDQTIRSSRTVEATGWEVTVVRNRAGLITQLRQLAIAQGLGILLVMLAVVSFGVWEYRTTLGQTRQLLDGFAALEEGDFSYSLDLAAAEEWQQISEGFNALATSLAAREATLKQREQRLQVLNRVLRHNLRNSASVVLGYAEVIRDTADDPSVLDAAISIEEAGNGLESISEKARQLELTVGASDAPAAQDLVPLIEDVLQDVRSKYPRVDVTASLPEAAWAQAGSSLRLAIENICENACEHNESADPWIEVAIEADDDAVAITVSDNGTGIPEYERSVIHTGEETPLEHGSGLGLWVAKWAVDQFDGSLDFELREPTGSTVTIQLHPAEAPSADESENQTGGSG